MGSGGGGNSTTEPVHSAEMRQLQAAALPEIKRMMALNPLSSYAAWSPRQIAGSNPAYESLFAQANAGVPGLNGLDLIFGGGQPQAGGGDGMAIPSMGGSGASGGSGSSGSGFGMDGITPGAPPQFQPTSIQDTINAQVQAAMAPAITVAVNQAAPPRNSVQGTTYYDMYGNPHDLLPWGGPGSYTLMDDRTGYYGQPYIQSSGGGIPLDFIMPGGDYRGHLTG